MVAYSTSYYGAFYLVNVCNDRMNFLIRAFRKSEFYGKIGTPFSHRQTKNNTSITVFMNDENVRNFPVQILFYYPSEHIIVSNPTILTRIRIIFLVY